MEINSGKFEELCMLKGRTKAAQEYVNSAEYVDAEVLCSIIGIDTEKLKEREQIRAEKYSKHAD